MAGKDKEIREEEENRSNGPDQGSEKAPSAFTWPFRKLWWAVEDRLIWPVSDYLAGKARSRNGQTPAGSGERAERRRPLAWVGATALATVAIGASAAAVFFYNEAEDNASRPVVVQADDPQTVIVPMDPTSPDDPTLEGVAPEFEAASGEAAKDPGRLPANAVEPAVKPADPAMAVAHRFATAFTAWEVGREEAVAEIKKTTTRRLGRELSARPPRLPENTKVPRARVLNVVEGNSKGRRTEASVSLIRAGAAGELRLSLVREGKGRWLVSKVKG